ncbi:YdgA family protein [Photobacterium angustum]|uniref:YdgA family protein n=1 Tax=Photobacterium angustum TaxID=661 RepID=UPI000AAB11CB|nr:YdgA family protein [Photobacterium angustum]
MTLDGQQYTDFNFALALKDLNYKAISRLAVMEEATTAEQQQAQMQDAMLALDLLVAKGATVDLSDLSMMTEQGKVNASLLLELKPGLARASENLAALPNKLVGNINISMPKGFVSNEPQLAVKVPELLQQKIITEDQDSYKLTVKVEGSQLVFGSGLKIPLSMLSMLMMH